MALTGAEIGRDVELGRSVHAALLQRLSALVGDGRLDASGPSRLPGWNRAQVITHLARNADSHRRMIAAADEGRVVPQYPGGAEERKADIDAGASRDADETVADLSTATVELEEVWAATDWRGRGTRFTDGDTPIAALPFLRVREAALHGVDLDIGIELDDLDPLYVRLELARLEMLWGARQPMGMTALPDPVLALEPVRRLGWLTGRHAVHGLPPAGIF